MLVHTLSFLNKLMKSWKNRVGPGVEDWKMDIDDSDDYDNDEDEDDDDANEFYFGIFELCFVDHGTTVEKMSSLQCTLHC